MYRAQGLVSLPFDNAQPGRFSAWAAGFYLHGQVEQGTLCPATMTTAAIALLRREPALWAQVQAGFVQPQLRPAVICRWPEDGAVGGDGYDGKARRLGHARQHHHGHACGSRWARWRIPVARSQMVLLGPHQRCASGRGATVRWQRPRLLVGAALAPGWHAQQPSASSS